MNKLVLNAPAKINIGLNIVSKRPDGFHDLETFFYPLYDLHDTIVFEKSRNFIFDSDNRDLSRDPDNLIIKAHTLIEEHTGKKLPVSILLKKTIPIGAGLGGGSSDAAAVLVGLNEFFSLNIKNEDLHELALVLGSDVPFFILSKPAVGYSRGEVLKRSNLFIEKPILVVNPGIHISTREAFANIKPAVSSFDYTYFIENEELDIDFLSRSLRNDFEDYVFNKYAEISEIKNQMISSCALFSSMSGTGSTVYGIFNNEDDARESASGFPDSYFKFISAI